MLLFYATIKLVNRTIEQTFQWLKEESGYRAMTTHMGLGASLILISVEVFALS